MSSVTREAGGYAHERFKQGRTSWRKRTKWLAVACFGPFVVAGLVMPLLDPTRLAAWFAGVVLGAALAAWAILRDTPPPHVEHWRTGAEGERKTAKSLKRLHAREWHVVHDVDAGRGNYDHIVVGPAGVFVLDTKWPSGTMSVDDGGVRLTRREDPNAEVRDTRVIPRAKGAAASLSEELQRRTGHRVWVEPAIVVWCPLANGIYVQDRCTIIQGRRLVGWLESRPARLQPVALAAIRAAVDALACEDRRAA